MLKRFFSYYKPHIRMFVLDMLASLMISVIGMVYPMVTNRMLNRYIPNRMYSAIVTAGIIVLALYILRMLLKYFVQYYGHMIGVGIQSQMRRELFEHLESLPFSFFDDHETGRIMSRMTNDLFEVCELAHHGPENILTGGIMIALSFIYLSSINITLTLIIFSCVPLLIVVSFYSRRNMKRAFYTNSTPGFYIDSLVVSEQLSMDKITVEGTEIAVIPKTGVNEYEFGAYMSDKNGNPVENTSLKWEIADTGSGFTGIEITAADEYGSKAVLKVASDTTFRGIVKLKVTYVGDGAGENPPAAYYTVALENERVDSVEITGPARITVGLKREERQYKAVAKDPYGKVINSVESTWRLAENSPAYVSIDSGGVLTLSKEVENDEHITVYTETADGIRAEKTVVLQSQKNYWRDIWRLNVLKSAVDHVIEYGSDPYSGSPLLASGIDLRTKLPVEWKHSYDSEPGAFSDLAFDTGLYLVFDALSELTDDSRYTEKVDEIYNWYLDNGLSGNMLGYWGGHTFIDLKTLRPFNAVPNPNTHEFKNTFFYFAPFYRLSSEKAYKMGMHIWLGHVYDWKTLITNRHAYYTKVHDESNWENLNSFSEDYKIIVTRGEQPFRSMASDLVHTAGQMYAQTGDEKAKAWAMRILKCYYELADPTTGIMPTVYTTARGAAGTLDPMESIEPKGAWYTREDLETGDYTVLYGDRFFNQFAEDLVAQGFYPSSVLAEGDYTLTEGNYVENFSCDTVLNDLFFADMIGADTEDGRYVTEKIVKHMAGFIKYAWDGNSSEFRKIMKDGTDISTFKPNRNGYYGNFYKREKSFGSYQANKLFLWAACAAYRAASARPDLKDEADTIRSAIDYFAENVYGLGKIGGAEIGDSEMQLNYNTDDAGAYNVICLTDLYFATGKTEFWILQEWLPGISLTNITNTASSLIRRE